MESLPQCLCEPFGDIELQGFNDLHSPLGQKENCGAKQKHGCQGEATDLLINELSPLHHHHLLKALNKAGEHRSNPGEGWAGVIVLLDLLKHREEGISHLCGPSLLKCRL